MQMFGRSRLGLKKAMSELGGWLEGYQYDLFVFYNSEDRDLVKRITKKLEQRKIKIWIDDSEIKTNR